MARKGKIEKWFTRLITPVKYSWVDKKQLTSSILKFSETDITTVNKIYIKFRSLNADDNRLQKILLLIEKEDYKSLLRLSTHAKWGEDEIGDVPISNKVTLYIIESIDTTTSLYAIFYESINTNGAITFEYPRLVSATKINKDNSYLISNFIQIYPYE